MTPLVQSFFDSATGTVSYVVHEGPGSECVVIDPVLDYDAKSGRTSTRSAGRGASSCARTASCRRPRSSRGRTCS